MRNACRRASAWRRARRGLTIPMGPAGGKARRSSRISRSWTCGWCPPCRGTGKGVEKGGRVSQGGLNRSGFGPPCDTRPFLWQPVRTRALVRWPAVMVGEDHVVGDADEQRRNKVFAIVPVHSGDGHGRL